MNYINSLRKLAFVSAIGISSIATAQTVQPLAFPAPGTGTVNNWYKNYVGIRFQVTNPASIAGDKDYTTSNDLTGSTGIWGGAPTTMSDTVKFAASDSLAGAAFPAGYFNGKIALIYRGGGIEFGFKALQAQNAGAVAVVLINNVAGGPVGMAAGGSGGSVTIPVFMVSIDDGMDMTAQLRASQPVVLNININWASGFRNDLGFVPAGISISANNAMPFNQLNTATTPEAYKMKNGAFIANYGSSSATNVKLKSTTSFTPTGGSSSVIASDSVVLSTFLVRDSIWAMYAPTTSLPIQTAKGRYDLKYNISSDSTDQFTGDNNHTYSFYTTDSLWSKGRYDFTRNKPVTTTYTRPGGTSTDPFIWTVPYYVANGTGTYFKNVQFSCVNGVGLLPSGGQVFIYVFKWTDAAATMDSLMENSELELVAAGVKTFDGIADSAFQTFNVPIFNDTLYGGTGNSVQLANNSWYVIGAELPNGYALGCDGVLSGLPRSFGRSHFPTGRYHEYYNPIWAAGDRRISTNSMVNFPNAALYPWAFDGVGSYDIDSVMYDNQKGLIPGLPFTTTTHPTIVSVKDASTTFAKLEVYPNPTADVLNVNIALDQTAKMVTYKVIDVTGKSYSHVNHNNVSSEMYTFNTANLPSGNYYLIVAADGKTSIKKFTVAR